MPPLRRRLAPLVLSLLVAAGTAAAPTAPAAAAVPSAPGPAVVLHGSGWGHSVGMSQYGARVMAQQGRTATQILQHYYRGVDVAPDGRVANDRVVQVDLFRNRVPGDGRRIDLRAIGLRTDSAPPTSGVRVDLGNGPVGDLPASGDGWWVSHDPAGGRYVLHQGDGEIGSGPGPVTVTPLHGGDNPGILKVLNLGGADPYIGTYAWGSLRITGPGDGTLHPVLVQPMQNYLWGIAEVPGSWESAVLRAQAITARTYAGRIGGILSATPANQAYAGYYKERVGGSAWREAVDGTSSYAVTYDGELAQTYYSSSHGLGRSESSEDSWAYGATIPYLRSVEDPFSAGGGNPYNSWTAAAGNQAFAEMMGLARVSNVRIVSRTAGGSPKAIEVSGWRPDGARVTCTWSGGAPCPSNDADAKGAGARMRIALPLVEGGSGGRLRSQQISAITLAPFTDDESSVHQFNIGAVAAAGITTGCTTTTYCPAAVVNRGQMATFLARSIGLPADNEGNAFSDIATDPHRGFINALARAGRIGGFGDGSYRPKDPVSREQMASFLARAFDVPAGAPPDRFRDIGSSFHRENINGVAERGITGGCTATTYCPTAPVTREQMASFLARARGLGD